jgi:hypothetical protein
MSIGRMSPDKGPDRAIEIARRAGMPLVLVSKMREPSEVAYFEEKVRPLLDDDVTFLGESDSEGRLELLGGAEALINPIRWPEPFGLVMAESLACGTPVVAMRHGAAPEIVDDGLTGFLCADLDEMVEAVYKVGTLDRRVCRAAAEERFSVQRMAADHDALYRRLLTPRRPVRPARADAASPAPAPAVATARSRTPLSGASAQPAAVLGAAAGGTTARRAPVVPLNPGRKRGAAANGRPAERRRRPAGGTAST